MYAFSGHDKCSIKVIKEISLHMIKIKVLPYGMMEVNVRFEILPAHVRIFDVTHSFPRWRACESIPQIARSASFMFSAVGGFPLLHKGETNLGEISWKY